MDPRISTSRLSTEGGWPASPHAIAFNGAPGHVRRGSRGSLRGSIGGNTTLFDADGAMPLERLREEDEWSGDEADERSRLNPSKRSDESRPPRISPNNNANGGGIRGGR